MFQKALQFPSTIVLCYSKQISVKVIGRMSPLVTRQFFQTIVDCFSPIVFVCVFNQSCGQWVLSDALHSTISMNLKFREENQILPSFESLMDDESIVTDELSLHVFNIRRGVINVLDSMVSYLKVCDKKKTHNMISLMLDPRYRSLHIVSSFVGREIRCCSC
jgi:hypothetical protein